MPSAARSLGRLLMSVGPAVLDSPSALFRASRPARQAREWLGESLAALQDVDDARVDVAALTGLVAKAIGSLFAVQASGPEEPAHVAGVMKAMEHLREAMRTLQDLPPEATAQPAVHRTTQTIAAVLAFLYPLAKAQERASMVPPPPGVPRDVPHDPRRSTRRLPLDVDIGFQSDTNFYVGFSEDVSEGGLFVATYDFLPLGSRLVISFTLPDGHVVNAHAVVRWVREVDRTSAEMTPGMGVQFAELSAEDRAAIHRFLRRRAPLFYEHG
jgi:uncharacterized protein (TIGR02266 family)